MPHEELGVTVWVLREWRRKNYFPEPYRRDGRLWFTSRQVQWLEQRPAVFVQHGSRVTDSHQKSELEDCGQLIYVNWQ